jgi:hypothetical protein
MAYLLNMWGKMGVWGGGAPPPPPPPTTPALQFIEMILNGFGGC